MAPTTSTFTPFELTRLPSKAALVDAFVGAPLSSLRTPALVLNRSAFAANCARVAGAVEALGLHFRMHVKSEPFPPAPPPLVVPMADSQRTRRQTGRACRL